MPAVGKRCDDCDGTKHHERACSKLALVWRETYTGADERRESSFHCRLCIAQGKAFVVHSPSSLYGHLLDHRLGVLGIEQQTGGRCEVDELALESLRVRIMAEHSFDIRCSELAMQFLGDYPNATAFDQSCLAQHIQEQIETWLEAEGFNADV